LDYPADYKLLAVGGGSFNLAALTSGQIAATYLVVPLSYSAEEQGFNVLGYYKDYFPNYQLSVLAVKRGWAAKNVGSWCDFSRALSVPIAGSMRTRRRPSIFLPRRFCLIASLRAKDGNTIRRNRIWHPNAEISLEGLKFTMEICAEQKELQQKTVGK